MGMIVAVAVGIIPRMAVRVSMARSMRVGVHRCQLYSTSLLTLLHP